MRLAIRVSLAAWLLSLAAGAADGDAWFAPVQRLALFFDGADEYDRPYSLPARPRAIAGSIALSCEGQEGMPCGNGAGAGLWLESAAGFRSLSAAVRVRLWGGSAAFGETLGLDRAVLRFEQGPVLLQLGRDLLTLGPSPRAALMLSTHAAPQDGFRAELRAVELASWLKLSALYFIDRLRPPQTFAGTLLDCTRLQLDLFGRLHLGGSRFLQLGGAGAPDYGGIGGFFLEHFGRTSAPGGTSAENNRVSFDLAIDLPGARAWYEIAFEDTHNPFFDSVITDADHLFGAELRDLRLGPLRRITAEAVKTSRISQEHGTFRTGMTNFGRTLGSPLGPDGQSLWFQAALEAGPLTVSPWIEGLRFLGSTYSTGPGEIVVTSAGPIEHRQRAGADLEARLSARWTLSGGLFAERVGNAGLVEGQVRWGGGLRAALVWTP